MTKPVLIAFILSVSASLSPPLWAETLEDAGFKTPLKQLEFTPALEQYQFERSNFAALQVYDPLELVNRHLYHFNYKFDQYVFLPSVRAYRYVTPKPVRTGVSNFFSNLGQVPTSANSLLQGKFRRAMHSTARLLFNTILGVGGLWDPASKMGLVKVKEDFGQTLGVYGLPEGPYLMLPFLGPSNLRDTTGLVTDFFGDREVNLLNYAEVSRRNPELYGLQIIDMRYTTELRYGQLNSPFEYEKIRYIYTKARQLQINE